MIIAESYMDLMASGSHTLFELTWEFITLAVGILVGRYLMPRWKERFHRDLDKAHGIEHASDGSAHSVDTLIKTIEYLNSATHHNAKYALEQKERADALQESLARELRKNT